MAANEKQVGGDHYSSHGTTDFQHWDMVVHFKLDYFQGQITKYVLRWRDKGGIADLEKAKHFLEKYIEVARDEKVGAELGGLFRIASVNAVLVPTDGGAGGGSKKVSRQKVRPVRGKSKS